MKVFKRLIALVLSITLLTSTFTACSSLNLNANDAIISKAEWIDLLAGHFGLQNDDSVDPYFSDISQNNQNFKNVQACVEWGVLKPSSKFSPNSKVSREFVFATAVRAIGKKITNLADDASDMEAAKKAVELGFAKNKSWLYMHEGISEEEADKIATDASIVYCGQEIADHDNTKYQSDVKLQENTEGYIINQNSNTVTVSDDNNTKNGEYKKGDIVVFGTGKSTKQYKITGVSKQNGETVYTTEKPDISEVYDEIDVGGTGKLEDISDIHCAEGVRITEVDGVTLTNNLKRVAASSLGLANGNIEAEKTKSSKGANFKIELEFSSDAKPQLKGSTDLGNGWSGEGSVGGADKKANMDNYDVVENGKKLVDKSGTEISPDVVKKYEKQKIVNYNEKGTRKKTVKTGSEYKKGWKITGSVEVSNLQPTVDVKTSKTFGVITGFKSFDIESNPSFSGSVSVEGYATFEKTIAAVEYVAGPLVLEVALKMSVELNGKISFNVSVKETNRVTYDKKNGFKKVSSSQVDKSIDFDATLKITPVKVSVSIKLGWFTLVDASISVSVEFSLKLSGAFFVFSKEGIFKRGGDEAKLEDRQDGFLFCREYKLVAPIIELEIGSEESLIGKFGLTYTWKIMAEEDGLLKSPVLKAHCEGEAGNKVNTCTLDKLKPYEYENIDEAKTDENYNESTTTGNEFNSLQVDTYALDIELGKTGKITVEQLPKGYSMGDIKISVTDNGKIATTTNISPNGTITVKGVSEGTATVNISIPNTQNSVSVIVIVS